MSNWVKRTLAPLKQFAREGRQHIDEWLLQDTHRFTITGLSRSGKSMLFTSLMTMLKYRSEQHYNCLPMLERLPMELVESLKIAPLPGYTPFPLDDHIASLERGEWPAPTEELYGFKLIVRLRQTNRLKAYVLPYTDVVFEFVDYPGEWLTDLPMLNKSFVEWSDSAWAQQFSDPQQAYAGAWHQLVRDFDFDQAPTPEAIAQLVEGYRSYLKDAKAGGISLLQPGSFLLPGSEFNWLEQGFTPLPSKISSDVSHRWTRAFQAHYQQFTSTWLSKLKQTAFAHSDKQIILVDMFEGLNHSKQHLLQLKEALSHLSDTFVYGNSNWFAQRVLRQSRIGKVAFVATKADLLPANQHAAMLSLLQDITAGARARFTEQEVNFEHFLVSALQATDAGSEEDSLRYVSQDGQYMQAKFEALPESLQSFSNTEHYPILPAKVPADYLPRLLNGRGLDRLLQFLLG